ncbi:MAG: DUF937 domain-containing protein [Hyphomicrobiaceae bacterium]
MIKSTLAGSATTPAVRRLADALGTDPEATRKAMGVMIDALAARMERNTLSRGGLAGVVRAIGDPRRKAYLGNPGSIGSDALKEDGKGVLAHILGTKDASRAVAARAARASGIPADIAEQMLPTVASMMMGEVARAAQGPFDDILKNIPGLDDALQEMTGRRTSGASGDFGDAGRAPPIGGGSSGPSSVSRLPEQRPLPLPGETPSGRSGGGSRYDDLGDVLERGGFKLPRSGADLPHNLPGNIPSGGGGSLDGIIRAVLAALLGFQSRGVLGWIIRAVVLRYGWGFIQRILGQILRRALTGGR